MRQPPKLPPWMSNQYRNYHHRLPHTYAFGHFAAEAMLLARPHLARELLLHSQLADNWVARLHAAAEQHGVHVRVSDHAVERVRKNATVHAVLVLEKETDELSDKTHVVLAGASHYGNVGTIIRTMVAFGFLDLALVHSPLDAWNPHVLRASVGLRGNVRVASFKTLHEYQEAYREHAYVQLHTHHAEPFTSVALPAAPCAIVFGPEWPSNEALTAELAELPGLRVRIEQSNAAESLNVATAAAIVLHHWRGL